MFDVMTRSEAIEKQMSEKFSDILVQYNKEVQTIRKIFVENKDNPPCSKNQPPIGARISRFATRSALVCEQLARFSGAARCSTA